MLALFTGPRSLAAFHATVALEEKGLAWELRDSPPPAVIGGALALQHDELVITDALAISEYLAERFPFPDHPRLFPADLADRARARQVMTFLLAGPAESELVRVATALVAGKASLFAAWCLADADLAFALSPAPPAVLADYVKAQLARPSVIKAR